jgi:hypothetical protein
VLCRRFSHRRLRSRARRKSARGTRSLEGVFDGEALPAASCVHHEIALCGGRQQEWLLIHRGQRMYAGVVTTKPILSLTGIQLRSSTPAGRSGLDAPRVKWMVSAEARMRRVAVIPFMTETPTATDSECRKLRRKARNGYSTCCISYRAQSPPPLPVN